MIVIGIDPGLKGAIATISDRDGLTTMAMPIVGGLLDANKIHRFLKALITVNEEMPIAYMEHSQAMHKCAAGATFTFGMGFGILQGLLVANRIPFILVKPKAWQKIMHQGTEDGADPKIRSMQAAYRLFPTHVWVLSARHKKPHDGCIDSALIATYGLRDQRREFSTCSDRDAQRQLPGS